MHRFAEKTEYDHVSIGWVPMHSGFDGNLMAVNLAKLRTETTTNGPEPGFGVTKNDSETDEQRIKPCLGQSIWPKSSGGPNNRVLADQIS